MSPEETYVSPPSSPDDSRKKWLLLALLAIVVIVVVLGVVALFGHQPKATPKTAQFGILTTEPSPKQMTTQASSMTISFNQALEANSASVVSNPSVISATAVSGNSLYLTFAPKTLASTKTYTVTINRISSTSGAVLTDQKVTFKPTFVAPVTSGNDALINIGLSTDQVSSLFTYISQFDPWAQNVAIDESTIKHYMENPSDAWTPWAVSFSLNIDGTSYNVVSDFDDTEHIQVKIYNPANNQLLFTAGTVGSF